LPPSGTKAIVPEQKPQSIKGALSKWNTPATLFLLTTLPSTYSLRFNYPLFFLIMTAPVVPPMDEHISTTIWYGILSKNDGILKHCVRCHRPYTITSMKLLCSIPHVFEPVPFKKINPSTGETRVYYESKCCGPDVLAMEVEEPKGSGNIVVRKCQEGLCFLDCHTIRKPEDRNGINNLPCLKKNGGECCREWLQGIGGECDEEVVWSTECNRKPKARCKSV